MSTGSADGAPLHIVRTHRVRSAVRAWWRTGGARELIRFASVGLLCTVLYSGLLYFLEPIGYLPANLAASVVSTVFGTELHRRFTFRDRRRVRWYTAQWQSFGLATAGFVVTSLVLALINLVFPGTVWWKQIILVNGATALIGVVRYAALRRWVF